METDRLLLRRFSGEDAEALLAFLGDPEVNEFLPMFPLRDAAEAERYLRYIGDWVRQGGLYYAICLKGRPEPVGCVHVSGDDSRDLGYALGRAFWNRGICTEACRAVIARLKRTGIPIRSLYDGGSGRPSGETMRTFDVLVVDMQDVGLRFYTYHITMLRMMDACAAAGRRVIVLDRPNPNGGRVDGPVLDMKYRSGVGALPIPVLHGMTLGEIARMAVGEGWAAPCDLTVVPCRGYTHATEYRLPVAPSPNLPTQRAVYLYASLCPFEGTVVSLGRGTDRPFEVYGHPDMRGREFSFTPRPTDGAKHPPLEGRVCRGVDLSGMPLGEARGVGFSLRYVIDAYRDLEALGEEFFTPMFEKLVGVGWVRPMIRAGASDEEIRARWQEDVARFTALRAKYLLYE